MVLPFIIIFWRSGSTPVNAYNCAFSNAGLYSKHSYINIDIKVELRYRHDLLMKRRSIVREYALTSVSVGSEETTVTITSLWNVIALGYS